MGQLLPLGIGAGPVSQGPPHHPSQDQGPWASRAVPAPGIGHLPGERAGLWGAGDRPCCGVVGAGAEDPGGDGMAGWAGTAKCPMGPDPSMK